MFTTPDQDALFACLLRRSVKLARIYRGGLVVLADESNPCRYELAAHSLRELIEKSPLLTNSQAFAGGDTITNRLAPVNEVFSTISRSQKISEGINLESVAALLPSLLGELDKFFEWQELNRPSAAKRTARHLDDLSGVGPAPPVDFFSKEVEGWMAADDYFKKVAHNREENVDRDDFLRRLSFIENTLLRRLRPRSIEQLDELDALIKEAENG